MRKTLAAVAVLAATLSAPSQAEYLYGFGDVSVNYLDWTQQAEDSGKDDFVFLELEGGAGFDWGEIYGFADLESLEEGSDAYATSVKGSIGYKLGLDELRAYGQYYNTNSAGFTAQSLVAGLSYAFSGDNWSFNPFIGAHYTTSTSLFAGEKGDEAAAYTGFNGGMLGWNAMYNFKLGGEAFAVSNWHETEFARDDAYLNSVAGGETDELSYNGAVALWWHATQSISTGVQYRYAHNKLGQGDMNDAIVYTVKYNF